MSKSSLSHMTDPPKAFFRRPRESPPLQQPQEIQTADPGKISPRNPDKTDVESRTRTRNQEADRFQSCDLCNTKITAIKEHIKEEHGALVEFCDTYLPKRRSIEHAVPQRKTLLDLGVIARQTAASADGGEVAWNVAVTAAIQLNEVVQSVYPRASVYMFGSTVALGCWDGKGDVDFTVVNPVEWQRGTWPPKNEADIILRLARALRSVGFHFEELEPIVHTRVPIVKHIAQHKGELWRVKDDRARTITWEFERGVSADDRPLVVDCLPAHTAIHWDEHRPSRTFHARFSNPLEPFRHLLLRDIFPRHFPRVMCKRWKSDPFRAEIFHVDFDLSCRAFGIRNSILLRQYLSQGHCVRAGSVFIKNWSKRCGINNSQRGFLTSYAVSILWIYYMVQEQKLAHVSTADVPEIPDEEMLRSIQYLKMLPSHEKDWSHFDVATAELLAGFFHFYACKFDWDNVVVSLVSKSVQTKERLGWVKENEVIVERFRDRVWYRLCIEDPFEKNLNLGRHISPIKFHKVIGEFVYAYDCLVRGEPDKLLENRSAVASEGPCRNMVVRAMIGHEELPVPEILKTLHLHNLPMIAAFEVEGSATKLISKSGYKLVGGHDTSDCVAQCTKGKFLPSQAQRVISEIDKLLALHGPAGAHHADGHQYPLELLFVSDFGRYFLNEEHRAIFENHLQCVEIAVGNDGIEKKELEETVKMQAKTFDGGVLAAVLSMSEFFGEVEDRIVPAKQYRRKQKNSPIVRRDDTKCLRGLCTGCGTLANVWTTLNINEDGGWYCRYCWINYER